MCTGCKCNEKFKDLEEFIAKQDNKEAALIAVLHKAQELYGYLGEEVQVFISEKLNVSKSKIYGVISFYSYFTTEPKGKYVINVCTGTACFVRGAGDVLEEIKLKLGIKEGQTTKDGRYTLDTLRCVGACGIAPVVCVNDKVYGNFTKEQVEDILKECGE